MEHVGIDLAKNYSQICIVTDDGEIIERRIPTTCEHFTKLLGSRPRAKLLLESSTESEWVARHLESLGHDVVVADPNFAPMYAKRTRRIKTDRRDAAELAQARRLEAFRPAHRLSDGQRRVRAQIGVRDALVRTRVRYVNLIQTLLRGHGLRVGRGTSRGFLDRLEKVELPIHLMDDIGPLVAVLHELNEKVDEADASLAMRAKVEPLVRRLCTVPGVGPITASSFVAVVDDVGRFDLAREVSAYVGLVPGENSSGDKRSRGPITKAGNSRLRWLLVEAAWCIMRNKGPATEHLRAWASQLAARRGKNIAAVGLARRLSRILFAVWRDGRDYSADLLARQSDAPVEVS